MPLLRHCLSILLIGLVTSGRLRAEWSYEVLKSFEKPGANPMAPLVLHNDGHLYGTTVSGGSNGQGTVIRLNAGQVEIVRHLDATTGAAPVAGLTVGPTGELFGTTTSGGAFGFGTVIKLSSDGELSKVLDFDDSNGSIPGPLVLHPDGFLYGSTQAGGLHGHGTVFKLGADGSLTTLVSFTGRSGEKPGAEPVGRLAISGGHLFGLCRRGGSANLGTAFRVSTGGGFSGLLEFTGSAGSHPGANPDGGLLRHSNGNLYGTCEFGGTSGLGTAFQLTSSGVYGNLHHFSDPSGSQPAGELVEGNDGHLYGSSAGGGSSGFGGVYRLTTAGSHVLIHTFSGADGAVPRAGLVADGSGKLFGLTSAGGPMQFGTVFQVSTIGSFSKLANICPEFGWMPSGAPVSTGDQSYHFPLAAGGDLGGGTIASWNSSTDSFQSNSLGGTLGDQPSGTLVNLNGTLFGVCASGAATARGSAYSFIPGAVPGLVQAYDTAGGSLPEGPLVAGPGGLFGVSREGGSSGRGTIYRIATNGVRTRITSFTGAAGTAPGRNPRGPLALASNQSFYGTTEFGGSSNSGFIFRINALGNFTTIAEFSSNGPRRPRGGLIAASDGYLYGTTSLGGESDAGCLIRIDPGTDHWSVIASFNPLSADQPAGALHEGSDGAILGFATSSPNGHGAVFRYHPTVGLEVIASLSGNSGNSPGKASEPDDAGFTHFAAITTLPSGEILGTTPSGGILGGGTLFRILSPLQEWKVSELGQPDAIDLGDPDHDGLTNLIEYYLGTDPLNPNSSDSPFPTISSGTLEVTVPRDPAKSDIDVYVETSTDLGSGWSPIATSIRGGPFSGPGYLSGENGDAGIKAVTVRNPSTIAAEPKLFLRIRVEP